MNGNSINGVSGPSMSDSNRVSSVESDHAKGTCKAEIPESYLTTSTPPITPPMTFVSDRYIQQEETGFLRYYLGKRHRNLDVFQEAKRISKDLKSKNSQFEKDLINALNSEDKVEKIQNSIQGVAIRLKEIANGKFAECLTGDVFKLENFIEGNKETLVKNYLKVLDKILELKESEFTDLDRGATDRTLPLCITFVNNGIPLTQELEKLLDWAGFQDKEPKPSYANMVRNEMMQQRMKNGSSPSSNGSLPRDFIPSKTHIGTNTSPIQMPGAISIGTQCIDTLGNLDGEGPDFHMPVTDSRYYVLLQDPDLNGDSSTDDGERPNSNDFGNISNKSTPDQVSTLPGEVEPVEINITEYSSPSRTPIGTGKENNIGKDSPEVVSTEDPRGAHAEIPTKILTGTTQDNQKESPKTSSAKSEKSNPASSATNNILQPGAVESKLPAPKISLVRKGNNGGSPHRDQVGTENHEVSHVAGGIGGGKSLSENNRLNPTNTLRLSNSDQPPIDNTKMDYVENEVTPEQNLALNDISQSAILNGNNGSRGQEDNRGQLSRTPGDVFDALNKSHVITPSSKDRIAEENEPAKKDENTLIQDQDQEKEKVMGKEGLSRTINSRSDSSAPIESTPGSQTSDDHYFEDDYIISEDDYIISELLVGQNSNDIGRGVQASSDESYQAKFETMLEIVKIGSEKITEQKYEIEELQEDIKKEVANSINLQEEVDRLGFTLAQQKLDFEEKLSDFEKSLEEYKERIEKITAEANEYRRVNNPNLIGPLKAHVEELMKEIATLKGQKEYIEKHRAMQERGNWESGGVTTND